MKATDALARIHDRFAVDPISDVQVITREEFEAIRNFQEKCAMAERMKQDWIIQHPEATADQRAATVQRIASELGL